jgi:hypothetical protein
MLETPEELVRLQDLLDKSMASAGPHLHDIIGTEVRLNARQLTERLTGMRLLVLATVTADGRPLTAPVDGYFLHGAFWFSLGAMAVRASHLTARPQASATHLPGESLAVTVHGSAQRYDFRGSECAELRQAMLDHYLPLQGPSFAEWMGEVDAVAARLVPARMFTFQMEDSGPSSPAESARVA